MASKHYSDFPFTKESEVVQQTSPTMLQRLHHRLRRLSFPRLTSLRRVLLLLFISLVVILYLLVQITYIRSRKNFDDGIDKPDFKNKADKRMGMKDLSSKIDFPFQVGCRVPDVDAPRANASLVMLARNSELEDVIKSMDSLERHFNQWFNYPWVFLNDEAFDEVFIETVQRHTHAKCEFGKVSPEKWNFNPDIDPEFLKESIESQGDRKIMYGNMESYHKMCRFYSGEFFKHPLVRRNEWYWRVEPDVQFFCDITYDPFIEMEKHKKKYGFTVAITEIFYSVPSLFSATKNFIQERGIQVGTAWEFVAKKYGRLIGEHAHEYRDFEEVSKSKFEDLVEMNLNLRRILSKPNKADNDLRVFTEASPVRDIFEESYAKPNLFHDKFDDEEYNLCHFWSNFEIARTDLFLSDDYQAYFDFLENDGGFYRERWGDAPIHSIAVAMLLSREELHYFRDIGYKHTTMGHCPNNAPGKQLPYKAAYPEFSPQKDNSIFSIFKKSSPDATARNGVGCRCECPVGHKDYEDFSSTCIKHFAYVMSDDFKEQKPIDVDKIESKVNEKIDRYLKLGGKLGEHSIKNLQ